MAWLTENLDKWGPEYLVTRVQWCYQVPIILIIEGGYFRKVY